MKFYGTITKTNVYGASREVDDKKFETVEKTIEAESPAEAAVTFEASGAAREIPDTAEKQILDADADHWSGCYIEYKETSRSIWYIDVCRAEEE